MYLIAIAWMYVVVMMTITEAASQAAPCWVRFHLVLYGLLPLSILLYILGTPGRKRRIKERERVQAEQQAKALSSNSSVRQIQAAKRPLLPSWPASRRCEKTVIHC